ncbi:MAG: helix-turn-helix transcriptional regulator [Syntrophorhabdaceae bacterium]|nr:helix-turn-helix transcriptional regulator [Syntrophorhabdaceae bacterium]MDD5244596.1 helix-turn-helix transcriptional regulator [Syntrophorhabdaceae bacterium]
MVKKSATDKKKVRDLLRQLREKAGLRQIDLAVRLNKPQSFVSKYESGEKTLNFLEVREVCQVLNIPMAEFVSQFEKQANES